MCHWPTEIWLSGKRRDSTTARSKFKGRPQVVKSEITLWHVWLRVEVRKRRSEEVLIVPFGT